METVEFQAEFFFFFITKFTQTHLQHCHSSVSWSCACAEQFFFNTNLTMQEKVKHRRRESEEKVCVVWRKWKLCAFGICVTDPLKKCIRAIVEVAGLGESYSQRTPDH